MQAVETDRAALLTVVAHRTPRGAVPALPMYTKHDGTRVTSFGPCLKEFAGGAEYGTVEHEAGLEAALRSAQVVAAAAAAAVAAAAAAEAEDYDDDAEEEGSFQDPYGAAPNTLRFNAPLPAATLRRMLRGGDYATH